MYYNKIFNKIRIFIQVYLINGMYIYDFKIYMMDIWTILSLTQTPDIIITSTFAMIEEMSALR